MPLPDPRFVACFPLQEVIIDKDTGLPLSAGVITFYRDSPRNPLELKPIYEAVRQPDNTYEFVQIANPMILTSIGTMADDSGNDIIPFLFPYLGDPSDTSAQEVDLYYITVESATGVPQFTRDAWPPNVQVPGSSGETSGAGSQNIISNPQFVDVYFVPLTTTIFTVAGPTNITQIAPDWFVDTSGTGTFTVIQIPSTNLNVPGEPPFTLSITTNTLTAVSLRQRLVESPRILGTNFVSGSFVAKTASPVQLIMYYTASNGYQKELVNQISIADGAYHTLRNAAATEIDTTNTNSPLAPGYVDITIVLQPGVLTEITSVQVISVDTAASFSPYLQETTGRQIDHLFHVYKPQLEYKPIPSYLVGWDFPLNPSQFFANGVCTLGAIGANKSGYVWDQTIAFQTVDNSVSTARNSASNGLNITVSGATSFALVQYIPQAVARKLLSQYNAIQIKANVSSDTLTGTVSLWWTSDVTLPDIKTPNFNSLVSSIAAGVPTCNNGTWQKVHNERSDTNTMPFTLNTGSSSYSFAGFKDNLSPPGANNATWMAIVVAFNTMQPAQTMTIDYCSLVQGDIPTRPAPQTPDEVMRECRYYYRKSFLPNTTPVENIGYNTGETFWPQSRLGGVAPGYGPIVDYIYPMINIPLVTLYNPRPVPGVAAQIANETSNVDFTLTAVDRNSVNGFAIVGTAPAGTAAGTLTGLHWTADARLGTY